MNAPERNVAMSRLLRVSAVATALIFAAGLAACSASTTGKASATPDSADDTATLTTDPLSEYIQPDLSDFDELMHKQDEMIQQCMQAEGFEYTVVDVESTAIPGQRFAFDFVPERAWTEDHGYGIVETTILPPNYVSDLDSDPNYQYTQRLSPAQQKAYDAAMYGKSLTSGKDPSELPVEETGCNGKAARAFSPDQKTKPAILDDADKFQASLASSPQITAIQEDWAKCFLDAGYPKDARATFEEEIQKYRDDHPDATTEDPAVPGFRSEELAMALADLDCKDKVDYVQRTLRAMADLEKDYIAEHKGELEEAKLWMNSKDSK